MTAAAGPLVMEEILSETAYNHFMLLAVGIIIIILLVSPVHCKEYNYFAHSLIVSFVKQAETWYRLTFVNFLYTWSCASVK